MSDFEHQVDEIVPEQEGMEKGSRGRSKHHKMRQADAMRRMVSIAMFSALAYVCVFVLRFKVGFLTFDAKDAVMTVGALYFGPIAALSMSIIVPLLEFITVSDTGAYGLIMNFISSFCFTMTASLIYRCRRKLSGAVLGLAASVAVTTGVMMLANLFITPFFMGATRSYVAELIPTLLLPFNLTKTVLNAALVLLLYKPMTLALIRTGLVKAKRPRRSTRSMLLTGVIAAAIVIACVLVYIFALHGNFEWVKGK